MLLVRVIQQQFLRYKQSIVMSEIDLCIKQINNHMSRLDEYSRTSQSPFTYDKPPQKSFISPDQPSLLRGQLDQMLGRDYKEWRANRKDFNVINSQIAQNRQLLTQYLHGIYRDYRIPDPLLTNQPINRMSFSSKKRLSTPLKISKIQKPHGEPQLSQFIPNNQPYSTPNKHKKGLELSNPKQSQFSVSMPRQKPQYQYLTPEKVQPFQQSRMKIGERTAPSLHSSFLLGNSMNQGFSQTEMNKNLPTNGNYDTSLFQSRLSLASRLHDRSNHKSRKTTTDAKLQFTDLKQPLSLFSTPQKNYPDEQILEKRDQYGQMKIYEEKVKYQRENQLKRYQNKLYALRVSQNLHHLNRVGFNPQNGSIKQSFRYCIGCEQSILEANIKIHQIQCLEFKRILNLQTVQQITQQIQTKIQKILKQIQQKTEQIHEGDTQKIVSSSRVLVSEIEDFKKIKQDELLNPLSSQSFNWEYDKVIGIGKNWGYLTEQVNKLKWFLVVKNNFIKIQMQKSQ